jgi:hypothetical protein
MRRFCLYGTSAVVWTQNCPPVRLVATRWWIALRARNESMASAESAMGLASLRGASQFFLALIVVARSANSGIRFSS